MGMQELFSEFQKAKRKLSLSWMRDCTVYLEFMLCFWMGFGQLREVTLDYAIAKICLWFQWIKVGKLINYYLLNRVKWVKTFQACRLFWKQWSNVSNDEKVGNYWLKGPPHPTLWLFPIWEKCALCCRHVWIETLECINGNSVQNSRIETFMPCCMGQVTFRNFNFWFYIVF